MPKKAPSVDVFISRIAIPAALLALALAIIAVLLVLITYYTQFGGHRSNDQAVWGQFGDFVGGTLNPILAFLSLMALLITLLLQSWQLSNSAKELEATQKELQRSADANSQSAAVGESRQQLQAIAVEIEALQRSAASIRSHFENLRAAGRRSDHSQATQLEREHSELTADILRLSERLRRRRDTEGLSPTEVVRLWNDALTFGDIAFASRHTLQTPEELEHFQRKGWGSVEGLAARYQENRALQTSRAAFFGEYMPLDKTDEAIVRYETYYQDGRKWEWNDTLILTDGIWKIATSRVRIFHLRPSRGESAA